MVTEHTTAKKALAARNHTRTSNPELTNISDRHHVSTDYPSILAETAVLFSKKVYVVSKTVFNSRELLQRYCKAHFDGFGLPKVVIYLSTFK